MDKATPVQMRKSLEMSMALKQAMIRFVPIPAFDGEDFVKLLALLQGRLDKIERDSTDC